MNMKHNHWFDYERLHNHTSDSPVRRLDGRPLYYVRFNEPILTISNREFAKEFTSRLNDEFQTSFNRICAELAAKYGEQDVVVK